LHIDVTYLPKFDKQKYYLFVAIDRATRLLYYKVYENKSSENADDVKKDLDKFLIYYNFNRRHGSLRKELKVRTLFCAVQSWFRK